MRNGTDLPTEWSGNTIVLNKPPGLAVQLGSIVSGSTLVEVYFQYPGLGNRLAGAIASFDYYLISGIVLPAKLSGEITSASMGILLNPLGVRTIFLISGTLHTLLQAHLKFPKFSVKVDCRNPLYAIKLRGGFHTDSHGLLH